MKQSATGGDVVVGDGSDVLLSQPLWKVDGFVAIVKVWTKKLILKIKSVWHLQAAWQYLCPITIMNTHTFTRQRSWQRQLLHIVHLVTISLLFHPPPCHCSSSGWWLTRWKIIFFPIFLFHNNSSAVSSLYVTWETNLKRANVACLRKHNARFVLGIFHEKRLIIQVKLWIMWALTGLAAQRCSTFTAGNFNTLAVMIWRTTKWLLAASIGTCHRCDPFTHMPALLISAPMGFKYLNISRLNFSLLPFHSCQYSGFNIQAVSLRCLITSLLSWINSHFF